MDISSTLGRSLTHPPSIAESFKGLVERAQSVLIGTHLNPDGDAIGSALALSLYLDQIGIPSEVLCHHAPPFNLQFLPHVDRVRQRPDRNGHDLGVIVDLDSTERLGSTSTYFEAIQKLIVIDHHVPHEAPGDMRIIDQSAPATAVILCRLLFDLEADMTPEIATCLLTGIVTDTGSFRFPNTTPESLVLSAKLLECGGDLGRVSEEVFHRRPLSSIRLLGSMLDAMQIEALGRLAWSSLPNSAFVACGATDEDTEGFVNELLAIRKVEVAALFREPKPGRIRVSVRSTGDHDVSEVARDFGGGGHRNAAGMSFETDLDEVVRSVVPRLRACLESS